MTHHGRAGGRGLELLLLLGLLALSVGLVIAGALVGFHVFGGGKSPFAGGAVGFLLAGSVWRAFLKYYRYGLDLKPIPQDAAEGKE